MAVTKSTVPSSAAAQKLMEQLNRYQMLLTRRTRVETEVETATRQLAEAQEEAKREFGTGDIEKLRALYVESEADNERLVREFTESLNTLESALQEAEKQLVG